MEPIDSLLSRLEGVRKTGKGWTARCPAHEDRTASLSVSASDDGRTLIHCFAGCGALAVVAAIGLQLADLFPQSERRDLPPLERQKRREYALASQIRAALNVLSTEAKIVAIAARDILDGHPLVEDDIQRLEVAGARIDDAREVLA